MMIEYDTVYADYSDKIVYEYRFVSASYCCEEMKKAWDEYFIRFGICEGEYCKSEFKGGGNECNKACIYQCNVYACDAVVYDTMPIKYCPFCAEEIEMKEKGCYELKKTTKDVVRKEEYYEEVPIVDGFVEVRPAF